MRLEIQASALEREEAGEHGPLPGLALDGDGAVVLLDDPMSNGEAEAEPLRLRGDEGVEDALQKLRRDPLPFIPDLDFHQGAVRGLEGRGQGETGHNRKGAASGHCLDPVLDEVQKDLGQPILVARDRREARIIVADNLDRLRAAGGFVEEEDPVQELGEVHQDEVERDGTGQVQELLHDPVDPINLAEHDLDVVLPRTAGPGLTAEELSGSPDGTSSAVRLTGSECGPRLSR